MSDVTVVQPDVLFVAADRRAIISERGIEGPPTLAVEVLSPSSTPIDRERKLARYAQHGVPYYWVVDPAARSIETHVLAGGSYAPAGSLTTERAALPPLPYLQIDPADIWD